MIETPPVRTGSKKRVTSPNITLVTDNINVSDDIGTGNTSVSSPSIAGTYVAWGSTLLFCPSGIHPLTGQPVAPGGPDEASAVGGARVAPFLPHQRGKGGGMAGHASEASSLYPAIVQPIFPSSKWEYGRVLGCREEKVEPDCGVVLSKVVCSRSRDHASYLKHKHCNEPTCPVCYPKFAKRISDAVTDRVVGWQSVYPEQTPYHLVFWGQKGETYTDLAAAHKAAAKMLKTLGATAAVVWYHPYRIRQELKPALRRLMRKWKDDQELCRLSRKNGGFVHYSEMFFDVGFWKLAHDDALGLGGLHNYVEYGPHFHAIASGYLKNSRDYSVLTGCGYKKKGYLTKEDAVPRLSYYLSTHACYEFTKSTVRYLGSISYAKLARKVVETTIEDVCCEDCGAVMHEYGYNEDTGELLALYRDRITVKVEKYLYWVRGGVEPAVAKGCYTLDHFSS